MNKIEYMEQWGERFKELNLRKPTRLEKMSFRVGFNAGQDKANNDAILGAAE